MMAKPDDLDRGECFACVAIVVAVMISAVLMAWAWWL
jgi:hypothetical protein